MMCFYSRPTFTSFPFQATHPHTTSHLLSFISYRNDKKEGEKKKLKMKKAASERNEKQAQ